MGPGTASNNWQRALVILNGSVLFVMVVTGLYWAQAVFVPVALAIFLAFLLSPPLMALQRRGLGRTPAVVVVVTAAAMLVVGLGTILVTQAKNLAATLPQHEERIITKAREVGRLLSGGLIDDLMDMSQRVAETVKDPEKDAGKSNEKALADPAGGTQKDAGKPKESIEPEPTPVVHQPRGAISLPLPIDFKEIVHGLAVTALVFILVVFLLIKREDMRNRLIRLIGHGRITTTTKAVDDAGKRISRYLLMQLIINATFGTLFGVGLFVLSVPYAALWGFLGGILRYVPYLGAWIATILPLAMSVAVSDGWGPPLGVIGVVLALELLANNIMEPKLYGHAIGASEVALLIAAAFWTWLWGGIGLVLSGPLTVCLVVLGKYVPQLEFFAVALGDSPALEPRLVFYQRLLARDQDEAVEVIEAYEKDHPPEEVYDELLVTALNFVKRDRGRGGVTVEDEQAILAAVGELGDDLVADGLLAAGTAEPAGPADRRARLLCCPAQDAVDETALRLLTGALDSRHWDAGVVPANLLSSELLTRIEQAGPDVLCIASLPPGGQAHMRYLCKRLRQRFPDLKIIVGRWGLADEYMESNRTALAAVGADHVASEFHETRQWLREWRPVFEADGPVEDARAPVAVGV